MQYSTPPFSESRRNYGDLARGLLDRLSPELFPSLARAVRGAGNLVPRCMVATDQARPGSLLYSGFSERKALYWIGHFLGGSANVRHLGRHWHSGVCSACRKAGICPDFAVFEESALASATLRRGKDFRVPEWVEMVIELSRDLDPIKKYRHGIRKAQEHRLTLSVGHSAGQLESFYHRLYMPYARARHSHGAFMYSRASFEKTLQESEIYLLDSSGTDVAGLYVLYESSSRAYLHAFGIRDDGVDYLQWGISDALYALTLADLRRKGFTEVSMGGARPFLNDGLTRYKMAWSAVPRAIAAADHFRLVLCRSSEAAVSQISAAPFWHIVGQGVLELTSVKVALAADGSGPEGPVKTGTGGVVTRLISDCLCGEPCAGKPASRTIRG